MTQRVGPMLILSLLFTGIGLVCGYYGASRTSAATAPAAEDEAAAGPTVLAQETLKNMGVRVAKAELGAYSRSGQPVEVRRLDELQVIPAKAVQRDENENRLRSGAARQQAEQNNQ